MPGSVSYSEIDANLTLGSDLSKMFLSSLHFVYPKSRDKNTKPQKKMQTEVLVRLFSSYTHPYGYKRAWRSYGEEMKRKEGLCTPNTSKKSSKLLSNILLTGRAGHLKEATGVLRPMMLVWSVNMMKYHLTRMLGAAERVKAAAQLSHCM